MKGVVVPLFLVRRAVVKSSILATLALGLGAGVWQQAHAATGVAAPRVTGVSTVLDALEFGNSVGVQEVYTLGVSAGAAALPAPNAFPGAAPVNDQIVRALALPPTIFQQMKAPGAQGIGQLRQTVAPAAALNPALNSGLAAVGGAMVQAADGNGPTIAPFDQTVRQTGTLVLSLQEKG